MRFPFISLKRHDAAVAARDAEIKALRSRIFVLRDSMRNAKVRVRYNIKFTDNAAAYCLLDQAIIRDVEHDQ